MNKIVIIKLTLQIPEEQDDKKRASTPGTVCNNECFHRCLRCTRHILYFALSVEQPTQRKAIFRELTENTVYVNHNAKPIKGVLQRPAFHMAYSYISLKITDLLHEVFSQSTKIPHHMKFLV